MTSIQHPDVPTTYRIKVKGKLKESWSDWFDGMTIEFGIGTDNKPVTTLTGRMPDQGALFGLLNKVRDLGLKLVSVEQVEDEVGK